MFSMVDYYSDMGQLGQDCLPAEENMDDLDLDQVTQVIGYHPRFLRHFLRTQNFIMKGDGPLPYDYRYFLAIIAAARHQCPYLVKMYEKEFVNQGGNPEWLNGLDYIPSKLRAIYEINKILAHRPWLLRKGHIESLTKGINNWSLSEVVHAMVLLSHFHALSSFVFSCGLVQKLDGLSSPKLKNQTSINQQQLHQHQYQYQNQNQQHQHQHQQYHLYQIQLQAQNHQQLQQIQGPAQQMQSHQLHQNQHQQHPQQKNVLSEITLNNNSMLEQQINLHQQLYSSNASNGLGLAIGGRPALGDAGASAGLGAGAGAGVGIGESSFNAISNGLIKALDVDQPQQQQPQQMQLPQQPQQKQKEPQPIATVEKIMERMKLLSQIQNECSEAELSNRFKSVEIQTAELPAAAPEASIEVPPIISHYIEDPNFTYEDFARRGSENIPSTFRIQDYSWDDHGYSLVNDLYSDVGTLLDEKFRAAYNLTYFTMGGRKNVDTSKFRRAIWNYIQCIYGIRHDDYDYGEVNQLLDRPLKMFIKTACCFPERITTKDYDSILVELLDSEKVHVNLMIMEARNQAELLYALREIMRYMT